MTKLAAIYNIFDGQENLVSSIKSIRENVDIIIAVQQEVSNFGNKHTINLKKFLQNIKEIDFVLNYEPNLLLIAGKNEFNKRIIGLKKAIDLGCTHYLHIDCDEEYDKLNFKKAYNKILENDYDSTACNLINYFKFKDLMIDEKSDYYVPFIHKIQKGKMHLGLESPYPVYVDKTRKGNPVNNFYLFKEEELQMHHFSWVRNNIEEKLINSTARPIFEPYRKEIVKSYNDFQREQKLIKIKNFLTLPENILSSIPFKNYEYIKTKVIR